MEIVKKVEKNKKGETFTISTILDNRIGFCSSFVKRTDYNSRSSTQIRSPLGISDHVITYYELKEINLLKDSKNIGPNSRSGNTLLTDKDA